MPVPAYGFLLLWINKLYGRGRIRAPAQRTIDADGLMVIDAWFVLEKPSVVSLRMNRSK